MPLSAATASLIGAGVGGLSNVLGSMFGANSQKQVNAENYEHAKTMLRYQQQFAQDMWNKQNEYNKPENQVKLLTEGGINPSAVYGNNSMPVAGSVSLPSQSAPQGSAYDYQPAMSEVGRLSEQAINSYFQNRLLEAEKKKTEAESKTIGDLRPHQLEQLKALAKREDFLGEIARTDLAYYQAINGQRISQSFNDTRMQNLMQKQVAEQTLSYQLTNKLNKIEIEYRPKLNAQNLRNLRATFSQINASVGLINSNRLLTDAQKEHEVQKKVGTILDNGLKGIDYGVQKDLKRDIMEQTYLNLEEDRRTKEFERRKGKGTWIGSDVWHVFGY